MRTISTFVTAVLSVLAMLSPSTGHAQSDGPTVQPGGFFQTDDGTFCTIGFLFEHVVEQDDGTLPEVTHFATTAGHCGIGGGREMVWKGDEGPAADINGEHIGRFVFAANILAEPIDLALIRLDLPLSAINPSVCFFGGPIGLDVDRSQRFDERLSFVGQSNAELSPRRGLANDLSGPRVFYRAAGLAGDSGGPLLSADGSALGLVSSTTLLSEPTANQAASRLDVQLPRAEAALGIDLDLMTAPLNDVDYPLDVLVPPTLFRCTGAAMQPTTGLPDGG